MDLTEFWLSFVKRLAHSFVSACHFNMAENLCSEERSRLASRFRLYAVGCNSFIASFSICHYQLNLIYRLTKIIFIAVYLVGTS